MKTFVNAWATCSAARSHGIAIRPLALLSLLWMLLTPQLSLAQEWRSSAIGSQTFPTEAAALAATKALNANYALLDTRAGVADMTAQWTYYGYSVAPRAITTTDYVYRTGNYSHATEAQAYAFIYNYIAQNYSHPNCPPQLNAITDWVTYSTSHGVPTHQYKNYADIRYGWSPTTGCNQFSPLNYTMTRDRTLVCPANFQLDGVSKCVNWTVVSIYGRPGVSDTATTCNPCDVATGEKLLMEPDYIGPTLSFKRFYHSLQPHAPARLGTGWSHTYSGRLITPSSPVGLVRADGSQQPLLSQWVFVNGAWQMYWTSVTTAGIRVESQSGQYIAYLNDGSKEIYSSAGRLLKIVARGGAETTLTYDGSGRVTAVADQHGHQITLTYDTVTGALTTLTDPANAVTTYSYDTQGNLSQVTRPDATVRQYLYEDTNFPYHITGVIGEDNSRFKTASYDQTGRVTLSELANGADRVTLTYSASSTQVEYANGSQRTYNFTTDANRHRRITSVTEGGLTESYVLPSGVTDPMRRVTQITDRRGNVTKQSYDPNQLTSRTEAFGTPRARTTTYLYANAQSDLPTQIDEPGKRTTFTYDSNGNVLTKTVLDTSTSESRTWTYTYNSFGQVLTAERSAHRCLGCHDLHVLQLHDAAISAAR